MRLPRRAGAALRPAAADPLAAPLALPDLRDVDVLIVDDDADSLEATAAFLVRQRARVRKVRSARSALAEIRRRAPDVMLADLGMPGEDGFALIARVRKLSAAKGGAVPAIALTAYAAPEDRARALLAGFQAHLTKPASMPELIAVVAALAWPRAKKPPPRRASKVARKKKR